MLDHSYWQKQGGEPLFPELEWNKPERRDQAGKLLIVGGNVHSLAALAQSFDLVLKTGVGRVKIALPDKTKKLVGATLTDAVFLPSTNSGEFSKDSLQVLLGYTQWSDTLLMPGDIGRNSQTAILIEELLRVNNCRAVITNDTLDLLSNSPNSLVERESTTVIASFGQLQKLLKNFGSDTPLTFTMDLSKLVIMLRTLTQIYPCDIVTFHNNQLCVAVSGKVSTTKIDILDPEDFSWRTKYASIASCYLTWYNNKPLEALTHCAHLLKQLI